jgi:hypothetical protein
LSPEGERGTLKRHLGMVVSSKFNINSAGSVVMGVQHRYSVSSSSVADPKFIDDWSIENSGNYGSQLFCRSMSVVDSI